MEVKGNTSKNPNASNKCSVVEIPSRKQLKVLLVGATGLIGGHCLEFLLKESSVSKVYAPTRRTLPHRIDKLRNLLIDFDRLDEYEELFHVDAIICCLGTTIKQAGSKAAFRKVDLEYCLDFAQLARGYDAKAFYLVSAIGADSKSPFFYNRVKGELEDQLKNLQYDYLSIYQPSLLLGQRDEFRLGEKIASKLTGLVNPFMGGAVSKYKPIQGEVVARAMVNECSRVGADPSACNPTGPQVNVYSHDKIVTLARYPEKLIIRN